MPKIRGITYLLLLITASLLVLSCSLKRVHKIKNITYSPEYNLKLDIYVPRKIKEPKKILVFVYGGSWIHGRKSLYRFLGKGFARKGVITVVIDYRLGPRTDISGMANDVATAMKWVKTNATSFQGDANNIYISGHSAGGHLAAMVATDDSYFDNLHMKNPIKGVVLIDAFGLDMYSYFNKSNSVKDTAYRRVFGNDPEQWKKTSPIYHLKKDSPPFIQLVGGRTFYAVRKLNDMFYDQLKIYQPNTLFIIIKRRRHIPMIFQFYNSRAKAYGHILNFIKP